MPHVPCWTAVVRLALDPTWMAFPRDQRIAWLPRIGELLSRHPEVQVSWLDADVFGSGFTDFVVCRFTDFHAYIRLWEALRDTELFSKLYLRIVDVSLGLERTGLIAEAA